VAEDPTLEERAAAARRRAVRLQQDSAQLRAESDELVQAATSVRQSASALPICPICRHDGTNAALRTPFVQYFRCPRCGYVWSHPLQDSDSAPKTA
jgi:transposase-like protein